MNGTFFPGDGKYSFPSITYLPICALFLKQILDLLDLVHSPAFYLFL